MVMFLLALGFRRSRVSPAKGYANYHPTSARPPSHWCSIDLQGMSPDDVDTLLNKKSGLHGLCGDSDMRAIQVSLRWIFCSRSLRCCLYRFLGADGTSGCGLRSVIQPHPSTSTIGRQERVCP